MLTNGNRKLGKNVWGFNLPRTTCHHKTESCDKYCYAKRGSFNFSVVKDAMERNLKESMSTRFVEMISAQIHSYGIKWVRVHVSGDYYSQKYADKWMQIARNCPNTRFLSYTRNYDIDFSRRPPNFVVYNSLDRDTVALNSTLDLLSTAFEKEKMNYSHMERTNHGYICDSKCYKCKACWCGKINVAFPIRH